MSNASSPTVDYTREVRFAVVMYGGVSLAVYINGIAQELLRLVRSTARTSSGAPLSGTERIYRKLSYLLAEDTNGSEPSEDQITDPRPVPPTRFVVDILSGTSAGGINGIFLAKALANGQDIDQLKDLWVREGDIETLINDKESIEKYLYLQDPPTSLLNSERMYYELLKAFEGMDKATGKRSDDAPSPYVDELDLFITSTDLQGVVLPIRLSDDLVYERRHRNVLHFVYSTPDMSGETKIRNDFLAKYNPFLAYAARCTSSFPFAFEPMCLCDTDKILNELPAYRDDDNCKSGSREWQRFYKDYLDPRGVSTVPFPKRAFGDGGYLDNKPFSYATDTLMNRHADVPVDRKLLYIEPSPEHPEDDKEREQKPDAINNVMSALNLPRYETIREDLQRVMDRNRLIERINRITAGVDRDAESVKSPRGGKEERWLHLGALERPPSKELWAKPSLTDEEVGQLDLADMIKRNGRAYAGYHRLRIAAVTDDLAELVVRVGGFDEDSDYFIIIRSLVRAWRDRTYAEYRSEADGSQLPINRFLFDFDLSYPIRRINYLRSKIDLLYRLDEKALKVLRTPRGTSPPAIPVEDEQKRIFREQLLVFKKQLNDIFVYVRREVRTIRARSSAKQEEDSAKRSSPIQKEVQQLIAEIDRSVRSKIKNSKSESAILDYFLGKRESAPGQKRSGKASIEDECLERAVAFLLDQDNSEVRRLLDETARVLKEYVIPVKNKAEEQCHVSLSEGTGDGSMDPMVSLARISVGHYYDHYEDYDLITYPIMYDADVGEADTVEIIRVSPEDAKQLIDERASECHKLAGSALAHFGAFLQKLWRQNDILWGRLDGAERIITALIPDHPLRTPLIGEAQAEIICETLGPLTREERYQLLAESLMRTRTGRAEPELLDSFIKNLRRHTAHNPELSVKLKKLFGQKKLRAFYEKTFEESSQVEPEAALRSAARATTVVGKMLSDLSSSRRVSSKYAAWIARMGQIFWSLVEVAVPRSFPNLLFRHSLKLLYFLEVLLIVAGMFLLESGIQRFGLTLFGLTASVHLAVVILGDLMQSRNRWVNIGKVLVVVVLISLIVLGVVGVSAILGVESSWNIIWTARNRITTPTPLGWNSKTFALLVIPVIASLAFVWAIRHDLRAIFSGLKRKVLGVKAPTDKGPSTV